jgi:hypothetical protein
VLGVGATAANCAVAAIATVAWGGQAALIVQAKTLAFLPEPPPLRQPPACKMALFCAGSLKLKVQCQPSHVGWLAKVTVCDLVLQGVIPPVA